jgi:CRP/FNR family transcriptional regulator, anaerobic regulatory protein
MKKPSLRHTQELSHCGSCHIQHNACFRKLSPSEVTFMKSFKIGEVRFSRGQVILQEGEKYPEIYTVLSGWVFKYKTLEDGRRQIVNYALPGDLIGLQGSLLDKMHHSIEALSDVVLCKLSKKKFWDMNRELPELGYDVSWLAAQDNAILAEFLVSAGQRTASERIAYLIQVLFERGRIAGLVQGRDLQMPISQEHFADTIGFSLVHTNKCMARLKRLKAFQWVDGVLSLLDQKKLELITGPISTIHTPRPFL